MAKQYKKIALKYAEDVVGGKIIQGKEVVLACKRFLDDINGKEFTLNTKEPDFVINVIEKIFVHSQGEDMDGHSLRGKPLLLQPWQIFCVYNLIGFYKDGIRRYKEALIMIPRKQGKAVSLDTEIPTPEGWKVMRDICVGDYVFGQDGKPTAVTYVSETFNKPMYAVTFEDGAVVKASKDHLWTVQTKDSRRTSKRAITGKNKWSVKDCLRKSGGWYEVTTEDIAKNYYHTRNDGKGREYKYRVPMSYPVEYGKKALPVDAYTLGVWLGDGSCGDTTVTCSDLDREEMMNLLTAEGHVCEWQDKRDRAGHIRIDKGARGQANPLREALRGIGVFQNKHIPEMYLQASIVQRLALLQGLMDTDGTCSKSGQCEFTQKSEALTDQFMELVSSLGIKAKKKRRTVLCNGKECVSYRVQFYTDKTMPCFRLKRKAERLKDALAERMKAKSIVKVERIKDEPSKCIAVDNENHLYLVGRQYTATHNTLFVAALAFALALLERKSGSKIYIVAASLKQASVSFENILYTLDEKGMLNDFRVRDNNAEHSINANLGAEGSIYIEALASNPKKHDSLNSNIQIVDELHAINGAEYERIKESGKAYRNKLCIGITTAGDDVNSFGYRHMEYAIKVVNGTVKDDSFFSFIARADIPEDGEVDFLNKEQHQKANPSYGITINPEELMQEAYQAKHDPQKRKGFLSRSLNIYTTSMKAYFDIDEFRNSDNGYSWTLEELAKLPIDWYGGADLSKIKDLTAACLYGEYDDVDIIITHAFFPVVRATEKAEEDDIPVYDWLDNGWLTMCNSPTINMNDVVNWFCLMRDKGFKIKQVGHDRKFAGEEYFPLMKKAHFSIVDQPQLFWIKSQGFRHIEKKAADGKLYYLHSSAYEYCLQNVRAWQSTDDAIAYEKIDEHHRIDLFDASVFACIRLLKSKEKQKKARQWFGDE